MNTGQKLSLAIIAAGLLLIALGLTGCANRETRDAKALLWYQAHLTAADIAAYAAANRGR